MILVLVLVAYLHTTLPHQPAHYTPTPTPIPPIPLTLTTGCWLATCTRSWTTLTTSSTVACCSGFRPSYQGMMARRASRTSLCKQVPSSMPSPFGHRCWWSWRRRRRRRAALLPRFNPQLLVPHHHRHSHYEVCPCPAHTGAFCTPPKQLIQAHDLCFTTSSCWGLPDCKLTF